VTDFFRDPEAWVELEQTVIAPLVRQKEPEDAIRVWTPGCATGEEPYSMAMLLIENVQRAKKNCSVHVFATDIDQDALETARRGRYPANIAADVSSERLQRFFLEHKDDHGFEVTKSLREAVVFAEQNLISDPPFSRLDLICCRNVMIYLEPEAQEKVLGLFHFALMENGYLFLGNAESIGRQQDLFRTVSQKWRIFRRIGPTRHDRVDFPVTAHGPARVAEPPNAPTQRRDLRLAQLAQQRLLDRFAPASVLVNRSHEILYFCGSTDDYLTQPAGAPTLNLLDRMREGLRSKVRGALHKAIGENQTVTVAARVKRAHALFPVRITIIPVSDYHDHEKLGLVVFEEAPAIVPAAGGEREEQRDGEERWSVAPAQVTDDDNLVHHLERELTSTREDLQATIEQLETSNEELKASNEEVMSINEELQSTNEELETSKEELQSLNEELTTVNAQLAAKVAELEARNDDLNNLLSSTDIAAICLDGAFRIKWFTPAMRGLINLMASDTGRPLRDFAHRFTSEDLLDDAELVLKKLAPLEREVSTHDGHWYQRRVLPFRTADNHIDGVVVTFTDLTNRKKVEDELKQLNETLEQRVAQRTELLGLVRDIAAAANEAESIEQALQFAVERICRHGGCDAGHVYQLAEDGSGDAVPTGVWHCSPDKDLRRLVQVTGKTRIPPGQDLIHQVFQTGQPASLEDVRGSRQWIRGESGDLGVRATMAFPVSIARKPVAVLEFFSQQAMETDERFLDAMQSVSLQLGLMIERKEATKRIAEATDREQRRIGQELHDGLGQQISGLAMLAATLLDKLQAQNSPYVPDLKKLTEAIEHAKMQTRALSKGLMPVEVEGEGLMAALAELVDSVQKLHGVECVFECPKPVLIKDAFTATHLYHLAQEAVHNALKHGRPRHVMVRLTDGDALALMVHDDGQGLPASPGENGGLGMRIMRYRAGVIGATLSVQPAPNGGVMVICTLPKK
jgi:two-component system CheB/CheR fusion protein